MNWKYFIALLALVAMAEPAFALRCGTKLVLTGDHQAKIQHICGEPASIQISAIYRSGYPRSSHLRVGHSSLRHSSDSELLIHNRSLVEVQVEEWLYNFGPRRFMQSIRFENGIVTRIKQLGYGY